MGLPGGVRSFLSRWRLPRSRIFSAHKKFSHVGGPAFVIVAFPAHGVVGGLDKLDASMD